MSPIEEHLITMLTREFAALGANDAAVSVLSAEAENWRFRVVTSGRTFELGFNHREQLWCRELTAGQEKSLVSNDAPRIPTSTAARQTALQLIHRALIEPQSISRDPPII